MNIDAYNFIKSTYKKPFGLAEYVFQIIRNFQPVNREIDELSKKDIIHRLADICNNYNRLVDVYEDGLFWCSFRYTFNDKDIMRNVKILFDNKKAYSFTIKIGKFEPFKGLDIPNPPYVMTWNIVLLEGNGQRTTLRGREIYD